MSKHEVHKYRKVKQKPSNRTIYKCMLPNCRHYTTPELVLGMESICWSCEKSFVLTKALLSQKVMPTCISCRRGNKKIRREQNEVTSVIDTRIEDIVNKLL